MPILEIVTVLIMLGVAYALLREGLLTAFTMVVNVVVAGLVAFNFFEPIADALESGFKGSFLEGTEDGLALLTLFALTLGVLRLATNSLAPKEPEYPSGVGRGGGAVCGLVAGYLAAGFLVCVMQTLPLPEDFLGFRYKSDTPSNAVRQVLPADRVWLALMNRAGSGPFTWFEDPKAGSNARPEDRHLTFDKYGTFELRYGRYRREQRLPGQGEQGEVRYGPPMPYLGEFDKEVHK